MLKNLQKRNEGFTIVEVMIVLAIAGLIILVVLLAVPALQRNARNSSIKSDAAAVAAAVNEYQGANNGIMPTGGSITGGVVTITGAGTPVTGKTDGGTVSGGLSNAVNAPVATEFARINVRYGSKCNAAGTALGAASPRSTAILFNLETSNSYAPQCVEA